MNWWGNERPNLTRRLVRLDNRGGAQYDPPHRFATPGAIASWGRVHDEAFQPPGLSGMSGRPFLGPHSPWAEHVPFGFALVEMLRPRTVVGVGDPTGVSYCALCQAIGRLGLPVRAHGLIGGSVDIDELKAHHNAHYGRYSSLILDNPKDVLAHFTDGSVDLLHLDGQSDDFEAWLPKLNDRGVLLLHGVNDRERDAAVWKFWADLRLRHPTFEFTHGCGLGVAAVGPRCRTRSAPCS